MYLCSVRQAQDIIGIAPLLIESGNATFIGDVDICDYQDFIVAPGKSDTFFSALLDNLSQIGVTKLDLKPVRFDSTVKEAFVNVATSRGCKVCCKQMDVTLELDLPPTWDDYLGILSKKQRHEVRRKLRKLKTAGNITYRVFEDVSDVKEKMETFFELFRSSRQDKKSFMTDKMASFFRLMVEILATEKLVKFYFFRFR